MSTTSAYGWNIPDNTDLVKDGALAIRTLGNAIDTSMNTALGTKKAGMVLLNTTSFSAVASQAVPLTTFNATYDFYKIIVDFTGATSDATLYVKMRASGTDSSAAYYQGGYYVEVGGASGGAASNNTTTGWVLGTIDTATASNHIAGFTIEMQRPFSALYTTFQSVMTAASPTGTIYGQFTAGLHGVATSYDQINVIASAGNISGKIQVYGYNQ